MTHSTLDSMLSGLARSTTKIKIGTNASADVASGPEVCLIRPIMSDGLKHDSPKMTLQQLRIQISLSLGAL